MAKYEKKTIDIVIDGKKYIFESSTHFKETTKVLLRQLIQVSHTFFSQRKLLSKSSYFY